MKRNHGKTWKRWFVWIAGLTVLLLLAGGSWGYWQLRSSLPILSGQLKTDRLRQDVVIERDAAGVPTIQARTRVDAAFGLGFLHGQERFFQMDLLRRVPAGRLAELVGQRAVDNDKLYRKHRFQQIAEMGWSGLSPEEKELLAAYTAGVNFGLKQLSTPPFEYQILRQSPQPWREEDCLMAMFAMLCQLQDHEGSGKLANGWLREHVPIEVFEFLCRTGGMDDAALDGSVIPRPPIPSAEVWSLRQLGGQTESPVSVATAPNSSGEFLASWLGTAEDRDLATGSNSFVVMGNLAGGGGAMLASDMHLGLRVPATWYRAVIQSPPLYGSETEPEAQRRLVGVTLPGTPLMIAGSNGSIAWGFTNSYVDTGDVIELMEDSGEADRSVDPSAAGRSRDQISDDQPHIRRFTEEIHFPGGKVEFEYEWSQWGPIVHHSGGRRFAYCWIGNRADAFDLSLIQLEQVESAAEGLQVASQTGMPHQNIVIADKEGNVGWTVTGRLPDRVNGTHLTPIRSDDRAQLWSSYQLAEKHPRQYNPPEGRIWTANNRLVGGEELQILGNGGYAAGHRAKQIRDRLYERQTFSEIDFLNIQLDDLGSYLAPWKEWFLEGAGQDNADQLNADQLIRLVETCDLRARVDSVGYRILHQFRWLVIREIEREIERAIRKEKLPGLQEDVVKQLLEQRPEHWLPAQYESWPQFLQAMVKKTEQSLIAASGSLEQATWGARNRARIHHPLAAAIPGLGQSMNMPEVELPGDSHVPRVQGPAFGASQRMVIKPGREEEGIYHQPGGQSGHPLSPYYRAGFEDWATGRSSPLLPGPAVYRLTLVAEVH